MYVKTQTRARVQKIGSVRSMSEKLVIKHFGYMIVNLTHSQSAVRMKKLVRPPIIRNFLDRSGWTLQTSAGQLNGRDSTKVCMRKIFCE